MADNFGINILGTGSYLPELIIDNEMMATIVETNSEWIETRTGMQKRHAVNGETTWYMGAMAAKQAISDAGINPAEIGLIIDTTITNDFYTPSVACIIQNEIGALEAACFDLNAACSGFVYALDTAKRFLQTDPDLKYALIVANEMLTNVTDYTDRASCILFGDGAAAFVIERSDKFFSSYLSADGSGGKYLYAKAPHKRHPFYNNTDESKDFHNGPNGDFTVNNNNCLVQDGKAVYKFATQALPLATKKAAEKAGISVDEIDWFIPHQANLRIIETAAKNIGVSMDKFIVNIQEIGNTSSVTIPLAFGEGVKSGKIKRGDKCCLVGFGAGLTLGAVIIDY